MIHQKKFVFCNIKWGLILLTCFSMAYFGCVSKQDREIQTKFYTFEYEPPSIQEKILLDVSIKIERFRSSSFYESNRIVFKEGSGRIDSYFYHRWWSRPSDLITYFLLRDMKNTGLFRAVLPFDTNMPFTHIIEGYLEEIYEKDNPDKWYAVLNINITLVTAEEPDPAKKFLFQKHYRQKEPCESKTPMALAEAMSKAMSRVSESIILDIYDRISQ